MTSANAKTIIPVKPGILLLGAGMVCTCNSPELPWRFGELYAWDNAARYIGLPKLRLERRRLRRSLGNCFWFMITSTTFTELR